MPAFLVHERQGEDCKFEARLGYVVWPCQEICCPVLYLICQSHIASTKESSGKPW